MRFIKTAVLVAGLVALSSVGAVGAQNATQDAGANQTYVGSIDDGIRVLDETYSDGTMTVEVEADRRVSLAGVKTSELNKFIYDSGGGRAPSNLTVDKTVSPGRNEITVPVETHRGTAAVALSTGPGNDPYYAVVDRGADIADPDGWGPIFVLILVVFVISLVTGFSLARAWTDDHVEEVTA